MNYIHNPADMCCCSLGENNDIYVRAEAVFVDRRIRMTASPPTRFSDPLVKPVQFVQRQPIKVFAFGESSFPVTFVFEGSPRSAVFAGDDANTIYAWGGNFGPGGVGLGTTQGPILLSSDGGSSFVSQIGDLPAVATTGCVHILMGW